MSDGVPTLTHPSTVGATSGPRERVEQYLDQAGAPGANQNHAALYGALCTSILELADAIRNNEVAGEVRNVLDRLERGLPHLREGGPENG